MPQGSVVSVHAGGFPPGRPRGLVFAKRLLPIGAARSGGFGAGIPSPGRVTLAVWEDVAAYDAAGHGEPGWRAVLEACSTRGSFRGARPIAPAGRPLGDEPIGVVTLGRASWRTLPRFLWRGDRLARPIRDAPGLLGALSAGLPLTGNLTFSLWESAERMLDFAYGRDAPHRAVVRARPPILSEQLNARLRPLRIEGRCDGRAVLHPERVSRLAEALRTGPRA